MRHRWWTIALVLLATAACSSTDEDETTPEAATGLVYISGLDDHLLPVRDTVPLHHEPDGTIIGRAPVDVLVSVHGEAGGWLEVTHDEDTSAGESLQGWVADFYLRGELHAVDPDTPGCPVTAWHTPDRSPGGPAHHLPPSTRVQPLDLQDGLVLVRGLSTDEQWWIDRRTLSEKPGPDIRRAPPDTACAAVTHDPATPHSH